MTSPLTAGLKFRQTGFNKNSTPAKPGTSEDDIATSLPRQLEYPDSPVAGIYDVTNTSSRLILLNNANRAKSGSKLRIEASNERIESPDPERHFRYKTPQRDPKRHENCIDSSTAHFERPASSMTWTNQSQRPAWKPSDESSKNNERHSSCLVSNDPAFTSLEYTGREARVKHHQRLLIHRQPATKYLHYLVHIAQAYDVTPTRQQRHAHYLRLLGKEEERGQHTDKEYDSYLRQINKSFLVGQQQSRDNRPNTAASTSNKRSARPTAVSNKKSTTNQNREPGSRSARDHPKSSSPSTPNTDSSRRDSSHSGKYSAYRSDDENSEKQENNNKNKKDMRNNRKKSEELQSTHVFQRPQTAAVQDRRRNRHEYNNEDNKSDTNSNSSRLGKRHDKEVAVEPNELEDKREHENTRTTDNKHEENTSGNEEAGRTEDEDATMQQQQQTENKGTHSRPSSAASAKSNKSASLNDKQTSHKLDLDNDYRRNNSSSDENDRA